MEILRNKKSLQLHSEEFAILRAPYGDVFIDIGTGDGRYALHLAHANPADFIIGIDTCRENLRTASRTAPANVLFVIADARVPPPELSGLARRLTVNFPWGSLLTGLLTRESAVLTGLAAIAAPNAVVDVRVNGDALVQAGGALEDGAARLLSALRAHGFRVDHLEEMNADALRRCSTTWARRLAHGRHPRAVSLRVIRTASLSDRCSPGITPPRDTSRRPRRVVPPDRAGTGDPAVAGTPPAAPARRRRAGRRRR